jgi:hypothetical protein
MTRFGEGRIQVERRADRLESIGQPAGAVGGKAELVLDPGGSIVQRQGPLVTFDGPQVAGAGMVFFAGSHPVVDVPEEFEGVGRTGVDPCRPSQVAECRLVFVAAPIGLAALQMGRHRVGLQRNGHAEGFNGPREVVPGQGCITLVHEVAVRLLPLGDDQPVGHPGGDHRQQQPAKYAPHGPNRSTGNFYGSKVPKQEQGRWRVPPEVLPWPKG